MTPFQNLRVAFQNRMNNGWSYAGVPKARIIFGENKGKSLATSGGPWVRLSHTVGAHRNAAIGKGFQRYEGILTLQIFVAPDSGDKIWNEVSDAFLTLFQNQEFDGVVCYTGAPVPVGVVNEAYQVNAKIDFEYNVFS